MGYNLMFIIVMLIITALHILLLEFYNKELAVANCLPTKSTFMQNGS